MVNDKPHRDLNGNIIAYICQCGCWWYPEPSHGWDSCPGEQIFGKGSCPDRNYGGSKPHKRFKYRKVAAGQVSLYGLDVNKRFWGTKERLTESFVDE